jgi:hypothetical protein
MTIPFRFFAAPGGLLAATLRVPSSKRAFAVHNKTDIDRSVIAENRDRPMK